jgi:hypothetical protein
MPQVNPYDAYSDPTNPEMRRRLKVCYGALENYSNHAVRIDVSFGDVDGALSNNIALTFLEGTLVDAKVLVPRVGVADVDIPGEDDHTLLPPPAPRPTPRPTGGNDNAAQTDPPIMDIAPDRRQFLPRPDPRVYAGPFYKIGQRFRISGEVYLLCQSAPYMMTLVSITGGNRWTEGALARDPQNITNAEFRRICNGYADPVLVEE